MYQKCNKSESALDHCKGPALVTLESQNVQGRPTIKRLSRGRRERDNATTKPDSLRAFFIEAAATRSKDSCVDTPKSLDTRQLVLSLAMSALLAERVRENQC